MPPVYPVVNSFRCIIPSHFRATQSILSPTANSVVISETSLRALLRVLLQSLFEKLTFSHHCDRITSRYSSLHSDPLEAVRVFISPVSHLQGICWRTRAFQSFEFANSLVDHACALLLKVLLKVLLNYLSNCKLVYATNTAVHRICIYRRNFIEIHRLFNLD